MKLTTQTTFNVVIDEDCSTTDGLILLLEKVIELLKERNEIGVVDLIFNLEDTEQGSVKIYVNSDSIEID